MDQIEAENSVSALGNHMKALFENKQWAELGQLAAIDSIWFLHAPMPAAEALALAERTFGGAGELELGLVRIVRSENVANISSGTYTCRLGWYESDKVQQNELDFDLHLGFDVGDKVRVAYLGVTRADPFSPSTRRTEEPLAAPAQPVNPVVAGALTGQPADGKLVTVYMPVLLSPDAAQALLRGVRLPEG